MDDLDIIGMCADKQNKRLPKLIEELKLYNIPVTKFEKGDCDVDSCIELDNKFHIVVGLNGGLFLLKMMSDGCIICYGEKRTIKEVADQYFKNK